MEVCLSMSKVCISGFNHFHNLSPKNTPSPVLGSIDTGSLIHADRNVKPRGRMRVRSHCRKYGNSSILKNYIPSDY